MEDAITNNLDLADLMLYPISPSISCPSTYPMLDADPEVWNEEAIGKKKIRYSNNYISSRSSHLFICLFVVVVAYI